MQNLTLLSSLSGGIFRLLTILFCLFVVTGCAPKKQLSTFGYDEAILSSQLIDQDPELQPVESEPEIPLAQELEALALTGLWDEPQSTEILPEIIPEPVAEEPVYDFPVVVNRQVEMYLELFQGKQRKYFGRWLARSGRYQNIMYDELEAAGLPKDLIYLSMIESGFNQRAYSKSKAVGLWQFMSATGRQYGLAITSYVDERRDAEKSTKAAVTYLKDLYQEFNDWYLAVAAYNGGPGTMRKAMRKSKSRDFWKIAQKKYLRLETKRYVPKLIAAIIIAKEPEKYGFTDLIYDEPMSYDTLEVGPGLSLSAIAMLTNSNKKEIQILNQELRASKTPLDTERYFVKIPPGSQAVAQSNLPRLHSVVSTDYKTHIVKKNETLAKICKRYKINTTTLLKVNKLTSNKLVAGSRLRIPYQTISYRILPEGMDARIASQNDLILHTVTKGETVSKISSLYQVPEELIVAWNGLPSVHKITAGQQLALYMNSTSAGTVIAKRSPTKSTPSSNIIVLSDIKKQAIPEKQPEDIYSWYLVRNGDSLWTISRRFKTSPDDIKRWNNLKSNLIHPGSRLKLRDV